VRGDGQSHACYGGAGSPAELQEMFRADPWRSVIRLSEPARRESFDR
jgi:hypothetical protein